MPSKKETDAHICGRLFFYKHYSAYYQNKAQENYKAFQRQEQSHGCHSAKQQHNAAYFSAECVPFTRLAMLTAHISMFVHLNHLMSLYEKIIWIVQIYKIVIKYKNKLKVSQQRRRSVFEVETKYGKISFSQNIINKIVVEAVEKTSGKAFVLNYKGKYMNVVPGIASKMNIYDEEAGGIEIISAGTGIALRVYIVIKFGSSIKQVTNEIIDYIYEETEKIMGERPEKVTVVITGTVSKNIARRHIEVSR